MFECYSKTCRQRDLLKERCVIYIRWHDASYQDGPLYLNDIDPLVILDSAGILVKETETHYTIALDMHTKEENFRHVQSIPKGMVIEVRKFIIGEQTHAS